MEAVTAVATVEIAESDEAPVRPKIQPYTIDSLIDQVREFLLPADLATIRRAYEFADKAHGPQLRKSGDRYIIHPLHTARILADLRLDTDALVSALLHDVPEDTTTSLEDVEREFGKTVAKQVDGVTKLGHIRLHEIEQRMQAQGVDARAELWAESLRKMFLATADDVRVVLIKLADRLHNMQTLIFLKPEKRVRIARETIEIYAPLAGRLGIYQIKWQLEDLAFRHLYPFIYRDLVDKLAQDQAERDRMVQTAIRELTEELDRHGIKAEASGRPKHLYSIWLKMQRRGVDFNQIYDLHAVRIQLDEVVDCYTALGIVHSVYHPIPGQFDDYISMPKASMYQSLHTTVIGPGGKPLEVQIRTNDMHRTAEYGVAAHWRYKEGGKRDIRFEEKLAWLRQLLEWQKDVAGGATEFVEGLKDDIFRDQVFVFTPKGEIKELAYGATPLDFAYLIHTEIGHRCVGAKVNGKLTALDTPLKNGDIVEIMTIKNPKGPSRDWLNPALGFVKTHHAREKIRQWFKRQEREENITRGREQLDKELARLGVSQMPLEDVAQLFKYQKLDDFLVQVGVGEISPQSIATRLDASRSPSSTAEFTLPLSSPTQLPSARPGGLTVRGVGDLLTSLARCCNPLPGDSIVGYITRGKGVTVHRTDCINIVREDERERLIDVQWDDTAKRTFPVTIRVDAWDRTGLLRDVSAVAAEEKVNIIQGITRSHNDGTASIWITVEIADLAILSRLFAKLEGVKDVTQAVREGAMAKN